MLRGLQRQMQGPMSLEEEHLRHSDRLVVVHRQGRTLALDLHWEVRRLTLGDS